MKDNGTTTDNFAEQIQQDNFNNSILSAYIIASLDIERNFRLYSYRIINRDAFIAEHDNINRQLSEFTKSLKEN